MSARETIQEAAMDFTLAAPAITSPYWLQALESGAHAILVIGGVVILIMRGLITFKQLRDEYRDKKAAAREADRQPDPH